MAEPPSLTIVTYKHIGTHGSDNSTRSATVQLLARAASSGAGIPRESGMYIRVHLDARSS